MTLTDIRVDRVFIGSCTNSRIEDLRAAAAVLRGRKAAVPGLVSPGSRSVKRQAEEEGLDRIFRDAGLEWVESGCSMCVGMNGDIVPPGERCASTTNRNFKGRPGPGRRTHLMSPAMVAAAAVTGHLADARPTARRGGRHDAARHSSRPRLPAAAGQCRHRPDHPRALHEAPALGGLRRVPAARPAPGRRMRPPTCLDDARYQGAAVLVARRNFGSGSSREAAVYALADYGFRVRHRAELRRHLRVQRREERRPARARVSEADAEALLASEAVREGRAIRVDLAGQTITAGNLVAAFDIDPVWKTQLLNGWDDIDLTMARAGDIESFRARDAVARPWATPPG